MSAQRERPTAELLAYRALPSVDRLLSAPELADADLPRALLVEAAREALVAAREAIAAGQGAPAATDLASEVRRRVTERLAPSLRTVVNATGVILHTNLGRAPVSAETAAAMAAVAASYSNLEFDLASGERGSRHAHLRALLREVTGSEEGLAVNNNAGALLLALTALASGREVIVSRGQAVEIGGGFRIPDVMRQSRARLVEVGTTNRTYAEDYERAITPETALLLRVHASNFRLEGFVHSVSVAELVEVARARGVAVLDDVGSGALLDPGAFGLDRRGEGEPLVQDSVKAGAAVVCFSGDKLLGGPQAGLLVGQAEAIERIRRHPLARALRIDKASLAGLEATLRHYQKGEATSAIPLWRMLAEPVETLERRAQSLVASIGSPRVEAVATRATVGGGSLPQDTLSSSGLRVAAGPTGQPVDALARRLREWPTAVVGRVEQDALILDLRTVNPADDAILASALRAVLG
jgi:L-seryl-tRNA(Ser) seleniumtransferase